MQRKKNNRSKSPDTALERKSTLRKKIKQKQDESLKSNIVTSSDEESEESSSSSSEEEIVVSKKSKSQKEKQDKKEKEKEKEKPKPKPIKKTGKPDPLVAGYEEEVVLGSADDCLICADGGQILCCDNCHRAFHMKCIKLREKPTGDWLCPYCEDLQENPDICANCQESVSEMEHYELLTCSKCLRNMHYGCSDVPLSLIVDNPFNKNFIFEPEVVKELKQNLLKHSMAPEDLLKQMYNKHAFEYLFHICNECITTFGIQKIKNNVKQQLGDGVKDFYLAKLKRASDIHCAWLPEAKVEESSKLLLRHFKRNYGVDDEAPADLGAGASDSDEENPLGQDESYRVERILACKRPVSASKKTVPQIQQEIMGLTSKAKPGLNNYKFLIKWEDMEYHYVTWEDEFVVLKFKEKVTKYFDSRKLKKKSKKTEINESNTKLVRFNTQPNCFEGKLFEYQLIGVNWLTNQYIQRNNAILADEMGLGKTIQTLCLLKYLSSQFGLEGPFLIVAPTSTVFNWQREAAKWCPDFDVIIYGGDGVSRRKIMESEFVPGERGSELEPRFNMAITTYTFINQDIARLKKIKWEVVVVDEAQRLKNRESKLYGMCADLETNFKLLLTGTPIQNTIDELISLVRYIIPNKPKLLHDIDDLTSALVTKNPANPIVNKNAGGNDEEREEALKKLKGILKNHMLRRTVADANLKFPELEEKIVKLNLTNVQKHLYKNILLKNYSVLTSAEAFVNKQKGGKRGGENLRISLINVLTHLRLVCNHPDLFYSRSFNYDTSEESFRELVLNGSNKLKFLDKVIPRLLDAGHKILMFTQFVLMLDIIEEFLIFKNYEYDRLDGTTRNSDRQKIIDSFNNGRSKIFILSTRAGGLGINLTSSDTVIFVDSDFNPYRDIQAFCRAYRIGQKNKVMVYRLVSKFTVEEKIVENATKKLMLGEMIINPIDQSKSDKSVVESILRHGAMELFDKTFDQENDDEITEEKLDELLSREAKPITNIQKPKMNDLNDFYLGGFNFIDFSFAPIIQQANTSKSSKEDKYWETLMAQDHADYEKDNVEALGKGKRTKRTLQNQPTNIPLPTSSPESSSDSASEASEPKRRGGDKSEHSSEDEEEEETKVSQQVVLPENLMNYYNQLGSLFEETKEKGLEEIIKSYGLPDLTRLKFLEFVMKFGISPFRAEDVYKSFCLFIEPISGIVRLPDSLTFRHYLKQFYCCLLYENEPTPLTEFFFFKASPQVVRRRVVGFLNLKNKVNYYRAKPEKFKVRSKRYKRLFEEDGKGMETEDDGDNEDKWDNTDDYYLFEGISRYGMEEWDRIMKDSELWDRNEPKVYEDGDAWKLLFKKIEDKEPPENKELECVQYIKDYLRMRSNLLMNMLLEEKEKKSTKDDV